MFQQANIVGRDAHINRRRGQRLDDLSGVEVRQKNNRAGVKDREVSGDKQAVNMEYRQSMK